MSNTSMPTALASVAERFAQERNGVLSERVYLSLRHAIFSGDLQPGTWIKEAELTTILAVSRTPLREAIVRLVGEKLVDAVPNKGVVVRGVRRQELQEIYDVLLILEAHAARLAAEHATEKQLQRLIEILDLSEFLLARERWEEVTEQAVAFHTVLYEASNNTELTKIIESLRARTHAFRRFGIRTKSHLLEGLWSHQAIQQAVQNRDGDQAAAKMVEHLSNSSNLIASQQAREYDAGLSAEATERVPGAGMLEPDLRDHS